MTTKDRKAAVCLLFGTTPPAFLLYSKPHPYPSSHLPLPHSLFFSPSLSPSVGKRVRQAKESSGAIKALLLHGAMEAPFPPPPRQPAVPHPQVAASPQRLSDPPPCVQRGHPPSGGVTGCSPHQRLRGAVRSLTRRRPRERACRALFAITANHTHHHHF